jgi:hypothetical protein
MHFNEVSFGSQHESWSKQHNGKVRSNKSGQKGEVKVLMLKENTLPIRRNRNGIEMDSFTVPEEVFLWLKRSNKSGRKRGTKALMEKAEGTMLIAAHNTAYNTGHNIAYNAACKTAQWTLRIIPVWSQILINFVKMRFWIVRRESETITASVFFVGTRSVSDHRAKALKGNSIALSSEKRPLSPQTPLLQKIYLYSRPGLNVWPNTASPIGVVADAAHTYDVSNAHY